MSGLPAPAPDRSLLGAAGLSAGVSPPEKPGDRLKRLLDAWIGARHAALAHLRLVHEATSIRLGSPHQFVVVNDCAECLRLQHADFEAGAEYVAAVEEFFH